MRGENARVWDDRGREYLDCVGGHGVGNLGHAHPRVVAAVREQPVEGYIYVGTACSFPEHLQSGVDAAPLKEDDQYPASPESAYGWSKLMGEYEALLMEQEAGIVGSQPIR